jgi:toluene monooxygenase system protein A
MDRSEYYNLIRTTNWTPKYVTEDELFPEELSGGRGIPMATWETFDEPYKVTYSEYVSTQREKDSGAYSVKAALERADFVKTAAPGWISILKAHYGAIAVAEYAAATAEGRMARFSKAPGNRNMATFGMMDEIRHGQIQLYFPHEHTIRDRQWDWAHKAYHSNEWAAIAARHFFDDMMLTRDAISVSIMLTFAFETGFTNMQFLGLASDAAEAGDHTFASLISSIQTDEARHAQQGGPNLKIMIENGYKAEAQKMIDVAFWRSWRLFAILTGPMMDYYTPLEHRKMSFKEFMLEWIVGQFERQLIDLGLDKPWYWDEFIRQLDEGQHAMHMGVWYWRPTVWWNPAAGVTPDERAWLEQKYPGWNNSFGKCWDVIIDNLANGRPELTGPATLPMICNMSNIPLAARPGDGWNVKDYQLVHEGRLYHFNSEPDRWCFQQDPERYKGHMSFIDRFLAGKILPPDLMGGLKYMGLAPGEIGDDAQNYSWMAAYMKQAAE